MLDQVWGTQFVSDSAVTSRIESVRQAIGDTGRSQSMIRTVHGRGYRFIADLDAGPGEADPLTPAASVGEPDADSMVRTLDDGWPLNGRDEEHQRTISAARGRKSGGMLLAGPTGLGKTRLASPSAR